MLPWTYIYGTSNCKLTLLPSNQSFLYDVSVANFPFRHRMETERYLLLMGKIADRFPPRVCQAQVRPMPKCFAISSANNMNDHKKLILKKVRVIINNHLIRNILPMYLAAAGWYLRPLGLWSSGPTSGYEHYFDSNFNVFSKMFCASPKYNIEKIA